MHKIRGGREKQGERSAGRAELEPSQIQTVLLERAKQMGLAMAGALLEQDTEELDGRRYERKTAGEGQRGGYEQTSIVAEGARYAIHRPEIVHACQPMFVTIYTEQTTEDDGFPPQHKPLFN